VTDRLPQERRWQGWREGMFAEARVTERCAYCSFTVSAPLEQARQSFAEHVCDRPKPEPMKRRTRGFSLRR
jgi:hypothetical protein